MRSAVSVALLAIGLGFGCTQRDTSTIEVDSPPEYVGASACRSCHPEAFSEWTASFHSRSMQLPSRATVKGDFTGSNRLAFGWLTSRMFARDDSFFVETESGHGGRVAYPVDYVIGDRDTQWYLTTLPGGRIQILPAYWDVREHEWFDPGESLFRQEDAFPPNHINFWTNFGRTWNAQCFDCHASQLRKGYDTGTGEYDTQWTDLSINCESCHGPGSTHIAFWESPHSATAIDTSLVNIGLLSPKQSVEACAQCHAKKRVLAEGFSPGGTFSDYYEIELLDDGAFWPNGRYRELNYNTLGFTLSPCFSKGGLTCLGCHDSHHLGPRTALQSVSGRDYDRSCPSCHVGFGPDHGNHKTVGCVDCHMPRMEEVARIGVYDHRIASPTPELTERLGIPNACDSCHPSKGTSWSAEWVQKWWGESIGRSERINRVMAIHEGRQGNPQALESLATILADRGLGDAWRASAAAILAGLPDRRVKDVLKGYLDDPDPLIRKWSVEGIGNHTDRGMGTALIPRLGDPSRSVRIQTARAIAKLGPDFPVGEQAEPLLVSAYGEYDQLVTGPQADDPEAQAEAGMHYLSLGRLSEAEAAYRRSLATGTGLAEAYAGLGGLALEEEDYETASTFLKLAADRDSTWNYSLDQVCQTWETDLMRRIRVRATARDYCFLGDSHVLRRSNREALECYDKALSLDSRHRRSLRNKVLCLIASGRSVEARQALSTYKRVVGMSEEVRQIRMMVDRM